jgi:hypothetical protein
VQLGVEAVEDAAQICLDRIRVDDGAAVDDTGHPLHAHPRPDTDLDDLGNEAVVAR